MRSLLRLQTVQRFYSKSLISSQTGGGLCIRSSEREFDDSVSRDCLLAPRHAQSGLQRSLWECFAPAAGEAEAKRTMKRTKMLHTLYT